MAKLCLAKPGERVLGCGAAGGVFSTCKENVMLITFDDGTEKSEFYGLKT